MTVKAGACVDAQPVFITGMSGSGLSTAARVMEDLGWYVTQNLPPRFMMDLVRECRKKDSPVRRIAIVADVRARAFDGSLSKVLQELKDDDITPTVLFLDARDDVLIKRFDSVRRVHPLQGEDTLKAGIERERDVLMRLKEQADICIDTSDLSVHDLRRAIESSFATLVNKRQHITVQSFGFKHGSPPDADLIVDARFLPNPFWEPQLREYRGTDKPVSDFVLCQPDAEPFIERFIELITGMLNGYSREGKNFITVGVGCTGGHHRSVAVAEEVARRLEGIDNLDVAINHRDINR